MEAVPFQEEVKTELDEVKTELNEVSKELNEAPAAEPASEAAESAAEVAEPEAPAAEPEAPAAEPAAEVAEPAVEAAEPEAPAEEPVAEAAEPAAEAAEPEAPAAQDETVAPETAKPDAGCAELPKTKEEVVEKLKELALEGAAAVDAALLSRLKQIFYGFRNAEVAEEKAKFLEAGGTEEDFQPTVDDLEETFKASLALVRQLRAQHAEAVEAEKQQNLARKKEILELLASYATSPEEADKHYEEVKNLMAEWRTLGAVPAEEATALWKNYQHACDCYYDQLRLNHEMRAYDFKKNLEAKERIVQTAERLAAEDDILAAFRALQGLHAEYRETGPVARELREELWNRFKEASTVINKRHQAHFETLKAAEEENLARKTELCEKAEAVRTDDLPTLAAWELRAQEVQTLQAQWKEIGFAPRKVNTQIYERFRAACNAFFDARNAFQRRLREELHQNLLKKTALCERAEALQESESWGKTMNELVELQKQWKEIGAVPRKVSDALWHRFNTACNTFFRRRHEATSATRAAENAALKAKKEIIARLEALLLEPTEDVAATVRELQDAWAQAGHVPYRLKEELYQKYRAACDRIYTELHVQTARRRMDRFRDDLASQGGDTLSRERQRLLNAIEQKQQEIKTYETNLGFFSLKSKSAEGLLSEVEKKIARLKEELSTLQEKLVAVRQQIKEQVDAEASE